MFSYTSSKNGENTCYANLKLKDEDNVGEVSAANLGNGSFEATIGLENGSEDDRCYCEAKICVKSGEDTPATSNTAEQMIRVGRKIDSSIICN